jgi:hypothetical protein
VTVLDDRYPDVGAIVVAYDDDEPRAVRALDAQFDRDAHHEPPCMTAPTRIHY